MKNEGLMCLFGHLHIEDYLWIDFVGSSFFLFMLILSINYTLPLSPTSARFFFFLKRTMVSLILLCFILQFGAKICLLTSFRDTCFIEIVPQLQAPQRGMITYGLYVLLHKLSSIISMHTISWNKQCVFNSILSCTGVWLNLERKKRVGNPIIQSGIHLSWYPYFQNS